MLVTGDVEFAERARLLRSHGMTTLSYQRASGHSTRYDVVESGYNYRMDDITPPWASSSSASSLMTPEEYHRPTPVSGNSCGCPLDRGSVRRARGRGIELHISCFILYGADAARRDASREGITSMRFKRGIHYPAVHRFSIFEQYRRPLPNTERVSDSLVTLPMYGRLPQTRSLPCRTLREPTR